MKNPIQSSFIHFGQIWSNLMKKEIVIFILMQQSTNYSTELLISSKSNSFVIMNCCQLWHLNSVVWFEKPLFSAVFLRHTIKTAVEVRRTAENCGFLNHNLAAARASCSSVTSSGHNIFFRQIEAVRGICRFLADSGKYGVLFSHPGMRRKLQKSGVIL